MVEFNLVVESNSGAEANLGVEFNSRSEGSVGTGSVVEAAVGLVTHEGSFDESLGAE